MGLPAYVSVMFYVIGIVFLGLYYAFRKKNKKWANIFQAVGIIGLIDFALILVFALLIGDPIPYFDSFALIGLSTFGALIWLTTPKRFASEVKRELTEKVIEYRTLPIKEAKEEIIEYLEHRKGRVWMENVIDDLKIEPSIVIKVVKQLHKEGKIK